MTELTVRTREIIAQLFDPSTAPIVEQFLVDECGSTLPLLGSATPESLERVRFAVLKISAGSVDKLLNALLLAKTDWRDVLMGADFAEDLGAHKKWAGQFK